MKKIIISESQMHGLNEYLDKKVLAPLKRYLDKYNYDGQMETTSAGTRYWNGEYSKEQLEDLEKRLPSRYLNYMQDVMLDDESLTDEEYEHMDMDLQDAKDRRDELDFDDTAGEWEIYSEMVRKYGHRDEYLRWLGQMMKHRYFYDTPPTWMYHSYEDIHKKKDWLIHFGDARKIMQSGGFTIGSSLENLAITNGKDNGDYAFAFAVDDWFYGNKSGTGLNNLHQNGAGYGKDAIMFQAVGIKTWHYGDHEYQVIFDKNTTSNLVPIYNEGENGWVIYNKSNGRPIIRRDNIYDISKWVVENYAQYQGCI